MKFQRVFALLIAGIALIGCTTTAKAETIVVRQPGLVEAVGQAVVGTVACTAEMCKGLVCGSTTVVQVPNTTASTVVTTSAGTVVQQPVVAAPAVVAPAPVVVAPQVVYPAVPLMPYGSYYTPYYRHYYRPCCRPHHYYRPYCW